MNVIFLDASSLMTPDPGLAFWTIIIFVILWLILGKFAFKPIAKALSDRTQTIQDSLDQAKKAREEMELLAARNEDLLKQAKEERNKMLHEAKDASARIIEEAREKAKEEYSKLVENARREIEIEKTAAMVTLKNQAGLLAIEVAEKILKRELADKNAQQALVGTLINEAKLN